jgi:beta-glucosidase
MRVERPRGLGVLRRCLLGLCVPVLFATAPAAAPADATVHPALWPERPHSAANPPTDAFVDALLARMSLEEKIGQMIQADIASLTPADLRTYKLGAVLAGGGAAPGGKVRTTPAAWRDLRGARTDPDSLRHRRGAWQRQDRRGDHLPAQHRPGRRA